MAGHTVSAHAAIIPPVIAVEGRLVVSFRPGVHPEGISEHRSGYSLLDRAFGLERQFFIRPSGGPAAAVKPGVKGVASMITPHSGTIPYVVGRPDPRLIQRAACLEEAATPLRFKALARRTIRMLWRHR